MLATRSRSNLNLSLLLIAILRWDVVNVRPCLDFVTSLASFNRHSRNISRAFDMIYGTDDPILPTSSSDCIILLIFDGEKRASYFFLLVGIISSDEPASVGVAIVAPDDDCDARMVTCFN